MGLAMSALPLEADIQISVSACPLCASTGHGKQELGAAPIALFGQPGCLKSGQIPLLEIALAKDR
jgi:hypothetical protein